MMLPDMIDARWIDSLNDEELKQAEGELRESFARQDSAEKARRGSRYDLMCGPTTLTNAWLRWSLVNNATRARGLQPRHRRP